MEQNESAFAFSHKISALILCVRLLFKALYHAQKPQDLSLHILTDV